MANILKCVGTLLCLLSISTASQLEAQQKDSKHLIFESAATSLLAEHSFSLVRATTVAGQPVRNKEGRIIEDGPKEPPKHGYTKGMAIAYADAYARLRAGDPIVQQLARAASPIGKDGLGDGLFRLRSKFPEEMSVSTDGVPTLRALYTLLFELGIRESDGTYNEGFDRGPYKPENEKREKRPCVVGQRAEAGLFQSSYNFSAAGMSETNACDDVRGEMRLAGAIYEIYRHENRSVAQKYLDIFREGSRKPQNPNNGGTGAGLNFQKATKSNPRLAIEFAAASVRDMGSSYHFIKLHMLELSPKANALFERIEKIVDEYGPPNL